MFQPFPLFVGLRHFASSSDNRLVSFISMLAITGLILGVALLIVVLSIMNGFDEEMEQRILGAVPHIRIQHAQGVTAPNELMEQLKQNVDVVAVTPFIRREGMATRRGKTVPIELLGIDPDSSEPFMGQFVTDESLGYLRKSAQAGNSVLLPNTLAKKLGVTTGDKLMLLLPVTSRHENKAHKSMLGRQPPLVRVFQVAGLFDTHTSLDQSLVLTSLQQLQQLQGSNNVEGIQVKTRDIFSARELGYHLLEDLPVGYYFTDWIQTHGNLYQAIQMSRNLVSLLVFLIIAVAVFNVVSMLMMTVQDKRKAIAILKTQGATKKHILAAFLAQGCLIGLFGAGLGVILGVVLAKNITAIAQQLESFLGKQLLSSEIYPIDYLPSSLDWRDILTIVLVALALNLLATLFPALRAANTRPVTVLNHE